MIGLDLLGAVIGAGENLASQTILVRVRRIDTEKLKAALDVGTAGHAIAPALAVVDQFPKLAIDLALPVAKTQLEGMGVYADLSVSNAPPPPRAKSEAGPAAAVGVGLGIVLAIAGGVVYRWISKRKGV